MAASLLNIAGGSITVVDNQHHHHHHNYHQQQQQQNENINGLNNNNNNNNMTVLNNNNKINCDDNNSLNATTTTATTTSSTATMTTTTINLDANGIKEKRQTLEQRKLELEKLLSEKTWLLKQLQKQEHQILQGNYEYVNLNEIFANLAQQYQLEQQLLDKNNGNISTTTTSSTTTTTTTSSPSTTSTSILRRKTTTFISHKDNQQNIINNNNSSIKRQSEISNRSSEYDNYPCDEIVGATATTTTTISHPTNTTTTATNLAKINNANKKRATPNTATATTAITGSSTSLNYVHLQRQHALQQQAERQMLQQHFQQQQQQLRQQQHQQQQQLQQQHQLADAVSLYSVNSSNVATLRQQHVAPQQQPIIVQYEKYCLSPTHQVYTDGGFIKSSQNIKRYISPLSSPTTQQQQQSSSSQKQIQAQPPTHILAYQQVAPQQFRPLDSISLAQSYISMNSGNLDAADTLRWRSQTNIINNNSNNGGGTVDGGGDATRSHSSDMLATHNYYNNNHQQKQQQQLPVGNKHLDDISISSLNSENQKKNKPKLWVESSLDGPVMRVTNNNNNENSGGRYLSSNKQGVHKKLSSHSMSAASSGGNGRHYSMSAVQKHLYNPGVIAGGNNVVIGEDGHPYVKLSQSTSYLNALEHTTNMLSNSYQNQSYDLITTAPEATSSNQHLFPHHVMRHLPPKPAQHTRTVTTPPPPPRPPPAVEKLPPPPPPPPPPPLPPPPPQVPATSSTPTKDIRIESPKNMTVITQATFQPYKEVTKPFEMSDFYKYSTKFRVKDNQSGGGANCGTLTSAGETAAI